MKRISIHFALGAFVLGAALGALALNATHFDATEVKAWGGIALAVTVREVVAYLTKGKE